LPRDKILAKKKKEVLPRDKTLTKNKYRFSHEEIWVLPRKDREG
jgi:hypothetical protein